jgi:glycosyltransferase involved in cell wall biosynthesis
MEQKSAILYIASRLPSRSETFVYREVIALRGISLRVLTASVRTPETGLGDEELERMARTSMVVYKGAFAVLGDLCAEMKRDVVRTLGTVLTALRDALEHYRISPVGLAKTMVHAVSGISLARRLCGSGVVRIHAHMAHVPASIAMYASMHAGIPFSFTGHGADVFRDACLLEQKLARASHVVCISLWHRSFYSRLYERRVSHYPIVRCGVDAGHWAAAVASKVEPLTKGDSTPMILSVVRLVPKKGVHILVRALGRMHGRGVAFRAVVAGGGAEFQNLKTLALACGVAGCIEWTGEIDHSRVADLLRESTVFALPCVISKDGDRDGIPVSLMEAMAAGVPCVSSDFPAIRELITDGVSGRLVPPEDPMALDQAISDLIRDSLARAKIAAAGKERVESEFSTALNSQRLSRVFTGDAEGVLL